MDCCTEIAEEPTPTDLPATLTCAQLWKNVRNRYRSIRALEIEYRYSTHDENGNDFFHRRHFAFKGLKRFRATSNDGRETPFEYPNQVQIFDGERHVCYWPTSRSACITANLDREVDDIYLSNARIPIGPTKKSHGIIERTLTQLRSLSAVGLGWRVLPKLEKVEGANCHVLESRPTHRRRWIDPQIDFAIRLEEYYGRISGRATREWPLVLRWAHRDFRLAGEAMWFPWRTEITHFRRIAAQEDSEPQVSTQMIGDVEKLAVNEDVSDALFHLQFPPGTVVQDWVQNSHFRIGNDDTEFDH